MTAGTQQRLGPILLAPGVQRGHVLAYLFAAFVSIGLFTYLVALTPYVLRINLGLPESAHGRISGDLQFWQEIALLLSIGWWGAMSDRLGRRPVYVAGFLLMAVAYALYAFASSPAELIAYRLVFALGIAASSALLAAVLADYADETSRGKLTGLAFFLNGVGSVAFFLGLTRLPEVFTGRGVSELWAGRYAYFVAAGIALVAGLVMLRLKPGRPAEVGERTPVLQLMSAGLLAGRNPRIALSYLSAFTARADMAIVTLFLTLWVVQAGTEELGNAAAATARAGMVVGSAQIAAVIWAPLFGAIGDRVDRLSLLIAAFCIATVGYGWVASLDDILALSALPALACLGMGLSSTQLASTVLLAQEAPAKVRGAVFGLQSLCGGLGILALSAGGGRLFDSFGAHAPFVAVAIANGIVLLVALARRVAELRRRPATQPAA